MTHQQQTLEEVKMGPCASEKFLAAFIVRLEDLLDALSEVFPECPKTRKALADFREKVKPNEVLHDFVIRQWHSDLSPHYTTIKERDIATLLKAEISLFTKLAMQDKWKDPLFDEESRKILFEYLDQLNGYAQIHCAVPKQMMGKIEETAMKIVTDIQSGQFRPESFNIEALTKNLLGDMSSADLEAFSENLPQLQASFESVIQTSMQQLGASNSGDPNGGGVNPMQLLQMFGAMQGNTATSSSKGSPP